MIQTPDRRAARVRRGDPRLRPARVRHARAARRAHRQRHASRTTRSSTRGSPSSAGSGVRDLRAVRRLGRRRRSTCACCARSSRAARSRWASSPVTHDHRRRGRAVRDRGAEAGDPRRRRRRPRRGDRDVRARGRVGRRQPVLPGRARQRRLRDQRPEDVDHRRPRGRPHPARVPHEPHRQQARGADDDLGPAGVDGLEIRGIDTMGGREVNDMFFTDCHDARPSGCSAVQDQALDAADGRAQPRAADHRRAGARDGRSGRSTTCSAYVKERKQFGRPIGSFQALTHRLADLATEIEATRLLVYDAARRVDANPGELFPREASMAKLKATETRQADRARGHADDGRLRLRDRVRHGAPRPHRGGHDDLRRHERDPARHHRQDARRYEQRRGRWPAGRCSCPAGRAGSGWRSRWLWPARARTSAFIAKTVSPDPQAAGHDPHCRRGDRGGWRAGAPDGRRHP